VVGTESPLSMAQHNNPNHNHAQELYGVITWFDGLHDKGEPTCGYGENYQFVIKKDKFTREEMWEPVGHGIFQKAAEYAIIVESRRVKNDRNDWKRFYIKKDVNGQWVATDKTNKHTVGDLSSLAKNLNMMSLGQSITAHIPTFQPQVTFVHHQEQPHRPQNSSSNNNNIKLAGLFAGVVSSAVAAHAVRKPAMELATKAIGKKDGQSWLSAGKVAAAGDKANKAMTDPKLEHLVNFVTNVATGNHAGAYRAGVGVVGVRKATSMYANVATGNPGALRQPIGSEIAKVAKKSK
jgi:hypothetical protein